MLLPLYPRKASGAGWAAQPVLGGQYSRCWVDSTAGAGRAVQPVLDGQLSRCWVGSTVGAGLIKENKNFLAFNGARIPDRPSRTLLSFITSLHL